MIIKNRIGKARIVISLMMVFSLIASLLLKSVHHSGYHEHLGGVSCQERVERHYHAGAERHQCFICDFFFSPYHDEIFIPDQIAPDAGRAVQCISPVRAEFGCSHVNYLLRAPPALT